MELKRVIANRKIIVLLLSVMALNAFFFIRVQNSSRSDLGESNIYRNMLMNRCSTMSDEERVGYLNDSLALYNALQSVLVFPDTVSDFGDILSEDNLKDKDANLGSLTQEKISDRISDIKEVLDSAEHVKDYQDNIQNVFERAEQLNTFSIFADKSSYSYKETTKSATDFQSLSGVSVSFGNDKAVTAFMNYSYSAYFLLLLGMVVVLSFFDERKKGLWIVLHSMKNGRMKLTLRRTGILLVSVTLYTVLLYGESLGLSLYCYGNVSLGRTLQSIPMFGDFIFPMTIQNFLCLFFIIRIASMFLILLVIWLILTLISHKNIAFLVISALTGVEYCCYRFIGAQSIFNLFKYFNLYYYIDQSDIYTYYRLLHFFSVLISRLVLMGTVLLVGIPFVWVLILFGNKHAKPVKESGVFERVSETAMRVWQKGICRMPNWMMEPYKILNWQKGILILGVFVFIVFDTITLPSYTYKQSSGYLKDFYKECEGVDTQKAQDYIDEFEKELNSDEQSGASSSVIQVKKSAISSMQKRLTYVKTMQEQGDNVWIIDDTGYERTFGTKGTDANNLMNMKIMLFLIVLIAGVFPFERKNEVQRLLVTMAGRQKVFARKTVCIVGMVLVLCGLSYGIQLYELERMYGLDYFIVPVKSITIFATVPINCRIGLFLFLVYFLRGLLVVAAAGIIVGISQKFTQERTMLMSMAVLLVPAVLDYMGMSLFGYVSVIKVISLFSILMNMSGWLCILPVLLVLIMGGAMWYVSNEKWKRL